MKITKYTHACVRLEHEGRVLVIDPGNWSEASALAGADAVLVTHEHGDHFDALRLLGAGVPVYAPAGADLGAVPYTAVNVGEEFTAAGFRVRAHGGRHATVFEDQPQCVNLGYLVDGEIYHPGDSVHVPDEPVGTLLVPMQASWLKMVEALCFVRAVKPVRAFGIHDGQLNHHGLNSVNGWLSAETAYGYRYLAPRESA